MTTDGSPPSSTRNVWRAIEAHAAQVLRAAGLTIVDQNVEVGGGELDLVARDESSEPPTYVFVEVRSRSRDDLGSPLETVDARKQRKVVRAATGWLVEHDLWERVPVRFDVIGVVLEGGPNRAEVHRTDWIRGAFEAA